jgi:hypothetical protein
MSGLIELKLCVGPRDEDDTMCPTNGNESAGLIEAFTGIAALRAVPAASVVV